MKKRTVTFTKRRCRKYNLSHDYPLKVKNTTSNHRDSLNLKANTFVVKLYERRVTIKSEVSCGYLKEIVVQFEQRKSVIHKILDM